MRPDGNKCPSRIAAEANEIYRENLSRGGATPAAPSMCRPRIKCSEE